MEYLASLDRSLFLLINQLPHTPFIDAVVLALSGVGTAGIIWFLIGLLLFIREEKKNHWFFAPMVIAGGLSWFLVEAIIKPLVARSRPAVALGGIILGLNLSDSYSFPSGHATIAFAMVVVLSRIEPRWKTILYILAVLISLSRIYIGKHYPLDVLAGGLLGWGIGHLSLFVIKHRVTNQITHTTKHTL